MPFFKILNELLKIVFNIIVYSLIERGKLKLDTENKSKKA